MKKSAGDIFKRNLRPEEVAEYFFGIDYQLDLYVPTEFVVDKPQIVAPDRIRARHPSRWLIDGEIWDYDELKNVPNFHGTSGFDNESLICVETWADYGDDGHVLYRHEGYRLLTRAQIEAEMSVWRKLCQKYGSGWRSLPGFVNPFWEDEEAQLAEVQL